MTLTLTIDDAAQATRILNDFCVATKYDPQSGITKADWMKQRLGFYMKQTAKSGEFNTAAATIKTELDAIVIY